MATKNDFKIFDELHSISRRETCSLEQINKDHGTNFPITAAYTEAWDDYNTDYELLKLSENCIEGDFFMKKMPSFETFVNKYNVVNTKSKRKFIVSTHSGVTKMPTLEEPTKITIPEVKLDTEEKLELEKIPLEDAFKTPTEEIMEGIKKVKIYGTSFNKAIEKYAKENNINLKNSVVFVPSEKAISNKELNGNLLRKHIFSNKKDVISSMQLWKRSINIKHSMYDANDLFLVNLDNERVKIGQIPYIFKDAQKYYNCSDNICYFIQLVGKRHL